MIKKLLTIVALSALIAQAGPVSYYGELKASGNKLIGSKTGTEAVQVKGVSFGWSNTKWESASFYNSPTVNAMVDDWKAEIIRAPLGYAEDGGYKTDTSNKTRVETVIDAAIAKDVYAIIDWHSHSAQNETEAAKAYFKDMAEKYGKKDNVIFEIYNEPTNVDWIGIKAYAQEIITEIRKHSDNLILVGTPNWDQDVSDPIGNFLDDDNVAYVFHFYANTHSTKGYAINGGNFRNNIQAVLDKNKPVFVTEFGTTDADGGVKNKNSHNASNTDAWLTWLNDKKISYCAWNVNNKDEGAAFFKPSFVPGAGAGYGTTSNMTAEGEYIYEMLQANYSTAAWKNGASSSSAGSSSSASSAVIIDDFEDEDGLANTLEVWYAYTDSGDDGASTIGNDTDDNGDNIVVIKELGKENYEAKISNYALSKGGNKYDPYIVLGLKAENNGTAYDLGACANGFSYKYKGEAHNFKVELSTVADYAHYYRKVGKSASWETVEIPTTDLLQPSWGLAVAFSLSKIEAFSWELKGDAATGSAAAGNLEIDDFTCLGNLTLPEKPSSSSAASSSSEEASSSSDVSSASGSSSSNASSSSASSSSSSKANSSSSAIQAESGFYWITRFNEGEQSAYNDYPFAFVYGNPNKVTIENEEDADGFIVAVDGEGVLKNAILVNETSYGAGAIGIKNSASGNLSLADCKDGFSYKYKGAAHQFKLEINADACNGAKGAKTDGSNSFYKNQPASNSYEVVTVTPAQFESSAWQNSWCEGETLDLEDVTQMAWELKYGISGTEGDAVSLAIDDVKCLGNGLSTDDVPSSSSVAASSSSNNSSSSSKPSSSSKYSSSSAQSSSSSGTTPIISLNVIPAKAGIHSIKNGVELQVASSATLDIYNLNGTKIRQFNFTSGTYAVSLADLPKGLYIARVQFNNNQRKVLNVPIR